MTRLDGLQSKFRNRIEVALGRMNSDTELHTMGVAAVLVAEGLRPLPTQMAYYSRGRMEPADVRAMYAAAGLYRPTDEEVAKPCTWTLKSRHLDGLACDLVPSRDGKSMWWTAPAAVWARMGEIGQSFGLDWGGTWPDKQKDSPHFQAKGEA